MIITRTPYRVSFFGGGTDFPEWFTRNGGAVVSTSINRYCYITLRELPRFFDHKHRIVYSRIDTVSTIDEIRHPAVREALRDLGIPFGVEIHHDGDLPAWSGIGSSSAFAVGVLKGLRCLIDAPLSTIELAHEAVRLERDILNETVGMQDQFACAVGGMNFIEFGPGMSVRIQPLWLSQAMEEEIADRMVLIYSGQGRMSHALSSSLVAGLGSNERCLTALHEMALRGRKILEDEGDLDELGEMLDHSFRIKAHMSPNAMTNEIEELYERGRSKGALGGKVLGAGGGGFVMFWLRSGDRDRFLSEMSDCLVIPARPEHSGSVVLFAESLVGLAGGTGLERHT